jgi:Raf kinase inhibitor-like YbhB/YbcL family protein
MSGRQITRASGIIALAFATSSIVTACSPQPATKPGGADSTASTAASTTPPGATTGGMTATGRVFARAATPASATPIVVTSTTFGAGGALPASTEFNRCGGGNVSPQLSWTNAPAGTKSFVVTLFDPDAPTSTGYWHWTVFNIPPTVTSLPAGAGSTATPVPSSLSGYTDFGFSHYGGPCPPAGDAPHHYIFSVFALDVPTLDGMTPRTTAASLMFSMRGHLLAVGALEGTFSR